MSGKKLIEHYDKHVNPTYLDILARDGGAVPEVLTERSQVDAGLDDIPTDVYVSEEIHARELETVWARSWQMVCRESAVGEPGSYAVYDIGDRSIIIVRDNEAKLRAFHNSCLHRGTRLCDGAGRLQRIRCPFHGFTWALNGTLKDVPCKWDFPQISDEKFSLPEVKLDTWGGFVFANFDPDANSLGEYLGKLPTHFTRYPLDERYVACHVGKYLDCNWKLVIEAFVETLHVIGLHPQSLSFFGDINSQYDIWRDEPNFSRMINPSGIGSPHLGARTNDNTVLEAVKRFGMCDPDAELHEGITPRDLVTETIVKQIRSISGVDISGLHQSEILDVIQYNVFPNLMIFGGFGSPLAYRVTPADSPHRCLFEIYLLLPFSGDRPLDAGFRMLDPNARFEDVEELTYYGGIIDQDADMMPQVQKGLRASAKKSYTLSMYQESRVRHFRNTLDKYLNPD